MCGRKTEDKGDGFLKDFDLIFNLHLKIEVEISNITFVL